MDISVARNHNFRLQGLDQEPEVFTMTMTRRVNIQMQAYISLFKMFLQSVSGGSVYQPTWEWLMMKISHGRLTEAETDIDLSSIVQVPNFLPLSLS